MQLKNHQQKSCMFFLKHLVSAHRTFTVSELRTITSKLIRFKNPAKFMTRQVEQVKMQHAR